MPSSFLSNILWPSDSPPSTPPWSPEVSELIRKGEFPFPAHTVAATVLHAGAVDPVNAAVWSDAYGTPTASRFPAVPSVVGNAMGRYAGSTFEL
jgi:hypothetical protein